MMNCTEVKQKLSAFYDAELSSDESEQVANHLHVCQECAQERHGFESLSSGVRRLDVSAPPPGIWRQIQEQLDDRPTVEPASGQVSSVGPRWANYRPVLAIAALVLIAIGLFAYQGWLGSEDNKLLAADFEQYAAEFQRNPDAAQQILLAKYDGRRIDLSDAVQHVGYQPAVAEGLPSEYSLDSVYVLKMPCCDCLQTICQRSDGSKIAIFEYGDDQRVTYGDRPERKTECNGKSCRMVEINEQFAVNWQQDGRHISVVGVRDQEELENLVASLN
jgi:hypothetical protein